MRRNHKWFKLLLVMCITSIMTLTTCRANANVPYPLYFGFSSGYGATTWSMIATANTITNPAILSAPVGAKDTGYVWGFLLGYYIDSFFAVEFNYMHFPLTTITFFPASLYFPNSINPVTITSKTASYSLFGKFIIPTHLIKNLSAFANAGLAITCRKDILANKHHAEAIFGAGLIYIIGQVSAQVAFQYYTGYGKSEMLPAYDFIPFLYQVQFALAYHLKL